MITICSNCELNGLERRMHRMINLTQAGSRTRLRDEGLTLNPDLLSVETESEPSNNCVIRNLLTFISLTRTRELYGDFQQGIL